MYAFICTCNTCLPWSVKTKKELFQLKKILRKVCQKQISEWRDLESKHGQNMAVLFSSTYEWGRNLTFSALFSEIGHNHPFVVYESCSNQCGDLAHHKHLQLFKSWFLNANLKLKFEVLWKDLIMLCMRQHEKCTTALPSSWSLTELVLVWFWLFVFFSPFYLFISPFKASFDLSSVHSIHSLPHPLVS